MNDKFYLLFVFLINAVMANTQTCKLQLNCQHDGTSSSTDLILTSQNVLEDVNKFSVVGITEQLKQQLLLNAELSRKLQKLYG